MKAVLTMADWEGEIYGHPGQVPRTMSHIYICSLYVRSGPVAFIGTPCSKHWRGLLEPGFYVVDSLWVVGLAPPACIIPWKNLYSKLKKIINKKGCCVISLVVV